jgi:hypothetical protein
MASPPCLWKPTVSGTKACPQPSCGQASCTTCRPPGDQKPPVSVPDPMLICDL